MYKWIKFRSLVVCVSVCVCVYIFIERERERERYVERISVSRPNCYSTLSGSQKISELDEDHSLSRQGVCGNRRQMYTSG